MKSSPNPGGAAPQMVSIIVLNLNGKHFLEPCLNSVFGQEYSPFEVILVDNGSHDGSVAYVRSKYPSVRLIEAGRNLGFAEGNNIGVQSSNGDLVVLLNNDTVVAPGWLQGLVDAVTGVNVAVASSLIITRGIPGRFYEKNGSVNFLGHNIMRKFEKPENIFFAGGASLIFKKALIGKPFDEEYFAYAEDVYLSLRCRFKGYAVAQARASVVHHHGGGTTRGQARSGTTMFQERNRLLNIFLFFRPGTILKVMPFMLANAFAKVGISIVSGGYSLAGLLRAYWWLCTHIPDITRKRRVLREEFMTDEAEVISWMTSDLTNGESVPGKWLNRLSSVYCRMVGLNTLESLPRGAR